MFSRDPRMNPHTAPVTHAGDTQQPYARRTISTFLSFVVALFLVGAFAGWYFFSSPDHIVDTEERGVQAQIVPQNPGHRYQPGSIRSGVYNFFYKMFSGIEDGLDDNPHNLKNVEHLDDMNLEPSDVRQASLEERFDGKILDYQGNVAGDIEAVIRRDGEVKGFHFAVKQSLTPSDKTRLYSIPEDEIKVVQNEGVFFIQLSKEQTEGLAAMLYDDIAAP